MRPAFEVEGLRLAIALRIAGMTLVHIHAGCRFLRARPSGRLTAVPVYPGEQLPPLVIESVLVQAGVTRSQLLSALSE